MNRKLLKVLDEIDRTEAKIAEWQGHLASLHEQRIQLEEKEIIRGIRAMNMSSRELLAAMDGLCAGNMTLAAALPDGPGMAAGQSGSAAARTADGAFQSDVSVPGDGTGMQSDSQDAENSTGIPPAGQDGENSAGTADSGAGMEKYGSE